MFRGREMAHPERGEMILNRLAEELADLAVVEQRPQQDGRNMTMMLGPPGPPPRGEGRPLRSRRAPGRSRAAARSLHRGRSLRGGSRPFASPPERLQTLRLGCRRRCHRGAAP